MAARRVPLWWRSLFAAVALVALVLPVREGARYVQSPKRLQAAIDRVVPVSGGGRLYADILVRSQNDLLATWLDPRAQVFLADRWEKKGGVWERVESGLPVPASDRAAAFTALQVERDGWSVRPEANRIRVGGQSNFFLPVDGSEAYDPELGDGAVFYTRTLSNRYRAAAFDLRVGEERLLPFPERRGHSYLPLWWRAGKTVFYQAVGYLDPTDKDQGFVHRLFVLRADGAVTMLPFGLSDSPQPRPYAVGGDERGLVFAHNSGFIPNGLFFYDVASLFQAKVETETSKETRAGYSLPRGCVLVTVPALARIQGFRLDPIDSSRIFLVGPPPSQAKTAEMAENSRIWEGRLDLSFKRAYPYRRSTWVGLMSLLAALGALVAVFRGPKPVQTTML